jgi:transcriptional regulator with GAF, ATPase, and Fis domain
MSGEGVDETSVGATEASCASSGRRAPLPGVLVVFSGGRPAWHAMPLVDGRLVLGRDALGPAVIDARLSRVHAHVWVEGGAWRVRDAGSRNGTYVGGAAVEGVRVAQAGDVLRLGKTIALLVADLEPCRAWPLEVEGPLVLGPAVRRARREVELAAGADALLVRGESGSGKEGLAQHFHRARRAGRGPFVAVNCATLPGALAERLLFGARRGAFSGAEDAAGHFEAADGGTLFLDEVGELSPEVQAKLLRALEAKEVQRLGESRARTIDVAVVGATHRDLRARVAEGAFRADLFFRLGLREVELPPLRERLEEVPWLLDVAARAGGASGAHASFVEACLMRPWPGNVRELVGVARAAAQGAAGRELRGDDLPARAGRPFERAAGTAPDSAPGAAARAPWWPPPAPPPVGADPEAVRVVEALTRHGGNQTQAARALGVARTTLIRRMRALGLPGPRKR